MVKLSIIIPYYESYEYTKKLLERLVPQITEEVEVILIDDGCNETRLDEFKEVKITHLKENGGGGKACNEGIKQAQGLYLAIIDSDDMVASDYVETLLKAIETGADIIYMDWQDICTGEIIRKPDNYAYWKAIYKMTIVPKFEEQKSFHFDVPFYDTIKKRMNTRYYTDKVLYYYNSKRPGNLSSIETKIKLEEQVKGGNMIKVEVIEKFTLSDFKKLVNIERKSIERPGELFVGDKFYCDKEMADYLLGDNKLKRAFVKVIEVAPEEKPVRRRTKKSSK